MSAGPETHAGAPHRPLTGAGRPDTGDASTPASDPVVSIRDLAKTYASGLRALDHVDLEIHRGEIFALLGPNGAGKTTLISIACGLVTSTSGAIIVDGHDIVEDFRAARKLIGLVPQELLTDQFETVRATVTFSRGLFGQPPDPGRVEQVLRKLSLWDKRDTRIKDLSGGMKRRVLIAKALAHDPRVLFLDEPTAGVDVELRREMWTLMRELQASGVTIVLTTHYIEEAELMADRVGVITHGRLIVVDEKNALMERLGRKKLKLDLHEPIERLPESLQGHELELTDDGRSIVYHYDSQRERTGITTLLNELQSEGIRFTDLHTQQSSLEEIFIDLVREQR